MLAVVGNTLAIRLKKHLFSVACFLCFNSQAQVAKLFDYPAHERVGQLWLLTNKLGDTKDTTLLFKSYDSLQVLAESKKDPFVYWYAAIFKANHQQALRFNNLTQRADFLKSRQTYFEQSPYPIIRGVFYFYLSNVYFVGLDFKEAFKYEFRANRIFEETGYENIPEAVVYLNSFFRHYYHFEDYRKAIKYSILAEKYNRQNLIGMYFILNNRGVAYLKIHDYVNAEKTFLRTIEVAQSLKNETYVGIASGNYGNTLRLQGKLKNALPYLYTDIIINEKTVPENSAISCLYIANTLLQLDSTAKAKSYIHRSTQLQPNWLWSNFGVNYYEVQALYYQKTGDFTRAILYKDSLAVLKDSLRRVFDNKHLMGAEAQMAAEKYLNDLQNIETEKSYAVWRRNFIIAALIILGMAITYALNQRRKRERQAQEDEQKRANELLTHATARLAQYLEHLKSKNELIEKMSLELERSQQKLTAQDTQAIAAHIQTLHQSVILTDSDWQEFKKLFDQVHPTFFEKLHDKYGDLSPAEIRLLALLKLTIPSKEMAFMLGVSIDSLRKSRYRLRKKLEHLQADTDLKGLIEQL